jgi:hypothetical protein
MYFNKTDISGQERASRCREKFLRVNASLLRGKVHHAVLSCAPSGEGLLEGLEWLATAYKNRGKPVPVAAPKAPETTEKDR